MIADFLPWLFTMIADFGVGYYWFWMQNHMILVVSSRVLEPLFSVGNESEGLEKLF